MPMPPSTTIVCPLMNEGLFTGEKGEGRSDVPGRPVAPDRHVPCEVSHDVRPQETAGSRLVGVGTRPGATALTVIPRGPSSTASVRTRPMRPAFAAV